MCVSERVRVCVCECASVCVFTVCAGEEDFGLCVEEG